MRRRRDPESPATNQLDHRLDRARQHRAEQEDGDADQIHPAAAVQIREPSPDRHAGGGRQQIGREHPAVVRRPPSVDITVGIAVLTTVASSAPSDIPSSSPEVIHRRRFRLIARFPDASRIRSGDHAESGKFQVASDKSSGQVDKWASGQVGATLSGHFLSEDFRRVPQLLDPCGIDSGGSQ